MGERHRNAWQKVGKRPKAANSVNTIVISIACVRRPEAAVLF
jgi:hypothetical protein